MDQGKLEIVAGHEAAHAVMRWLLNLPATPLEFTPTGGICHGDGGRIEPGSALLFTLAGFAWETGYEQDTIDLRKSRGDDFDVARGILRRCRSLRSHTRRAKGKPVNVVQRVETALRRWFGYACDMLWQHDALISRVADDLIAAGKLSERKLARILETYGRNSALQRPVPIPLW